jgi:nucleotide-binding universal stress UspA family protein
MLKPWRKVLCAVQFDASTQPTVDIARQIAEATGATVIFFHVVAMPPEALGQPSMLEPPTRAEAEARRRLSHIAGENPLMSYEIQIAIGDPAACIINAAMEQAVDLIVMATHGRVGLSHLFLGSVAERVVRESAVPVMTTRIGTMRHRLLSESVLIA